MTATPVLEIAESGYDIKTCADENKVFSSKLKTLKTKAVINMTVNHEAYYHELGYTPIHLYAGFLSAKPVVIGWIGQNNIDNSTNVIVNSTTVTNDSNSEWAADALVYIFWEQLS